LHNAAIGDLFLSYHYKIAFMSLTLRTSLGCTEAVIDDASILSDHFEVAFFNKEDDFDAISWSFAFGKKKMTLHYSIYNGISIFPTKTIKARKRENAAVVELANVLQGKLLGMDMNKHIA
jgi:hypothetical protein